MKILILANKLPYPPRDGGSIATMNMLKGLQEAGNRMTCLAMNTSKHKFPVKQIPPGLRESIRFIGVDCDCSIRPLPLLVNLLFSREPYIARRFDIRDYRDRLAELLREEEFDIIQMEGPYPGLYLDQVRSSSSARISLRAHNVEYLIWERKASNERSLLKRTYLNNMAKRLKRFELDIAEAADILVPISEKDAGTFRNEGLRLPLLTIPAGLRMDQYPVSDLPSEQTICYIGALDWLPNQEGLQWFLENVFDRVLDRLPGLKLHVAGRNAPAHFEKKLKHPAVVYHGEVQDALGFMQSYRMMVAPLLSGSGIRVKILEGMALGRPVVTTSAGIEGIPAVNGQHVVVEDDPEKFSASLIELLGDQEACERIRMEARTLVEGYFDTFELSSRLSRCYNSEE